MYKILTALYLILMLFFSACSNKGAFKYFKSDVLYEKSLEYTKVGQIISNFETKAIINATYLNSTDPKKWNDSYENFLIGIYIFDDSDDEKKQFIYNPNYKLNLNSKAPYKIKELKKTSYLYGHIPLFNSHAKYYIISFKKDTNLTLTLTYENKYYGKTKLIFNAE